eukprot:g47793.t1
MSKLQNSLSSKFFQTLVEGLIRRLFYKDTFITNDHLKDQIFAGSDISDEAREALIVSLSDLLKAAAKGDWDIAKLQDQLKETDVSEEHNSVLIKCWQKERNKVHHYIAEESNWNDKFSGLQWRIDVKSSSSAGALNEPAAIVQLDINAASKAHRVVQFEINKAGVQNMLKSLDQLDAQINSRT